MAVMSKPVVHFQFFAASIEDKFEICKSGFNKIMIHKKNFTYDFILKYAIDCIYLSKIWIVVRFIYFRDSTKH
jgi:hypothetical protein